MREVETGSTGRVEERAGVKTVIVRRPAVFCVCAKFVWEASTFKLITILGHTNTAKWHQLTVWIPESSLKLQRFAQFEAFCKDECTMCPHYKQVT